VPFLDHDIEAVPWHRIVEFWIDDELAWSRPERIDRLDELSARAGGTDELPPTEPLVAHAYVAGAWQPGRIAAVTSAALRAITWNLLFDRYDGDILRSDERWQDALDRLAPLAADVIVLCEVTPKIWQRVLEQPWVRAYNVSHAPTAPRLEPFGQAILARHPLRDVRVLELARRRTAVSATLDVGDRAIGVVALHLTSDKQPDAAALRDAQLAGVLAHVRSEQRDAWIVAGDFNSAPEVHASSIAAARAIDAWEAVRPGEPGYTFDAVANTLAAATSSTGRSTRLDRVLAIGLAPTGARLIGVEPGPAGIPPSDHYGVCVDFALAGSSPDLRTAPMTNRLALAIVPPSDVWGAIQRVRCANERGFPRWPPHITLAHPFVDDAWLDRALVALRRIASETEPFPITLERIAPIEAGSRTIVMFPDRRAARAIERIQAAVREVIPDPDGDRAYLPHLTVARDIDARTIAPFTVDFTIDRLVVLREVNDRYEVVHEIGLGSTAIAPACVVDDQFAPVFAQLVLAATTVDASAAIEPYGSIVYAPEHARDVDVVVEIDQAIDAFVAELSLLLEVSPAGSPTHLRCRIDNTAVELAIARRGDGDERALSGPRDGRALRQHLVDHGRYDAFLAAWPDVRRFVDARGIGGNAFGYFGGFGWASLLAIPLCHDPVLCTSKAVLADWFAWLARIEPNTRIGFDADIVADPAPLWLAAPTPPARNTARAVTAGTFAALRSEARRAARLRTIDRVAIDLTVEPPPGEIIELAGDAASRGAYTGGFKKLLDTLEAALGPVVRPWGRFEHDGDRWRHRITVPDARGARTVLAGTVHEQLVQY
jgi:poly(A) polymerase